MSYANVSKVHVLNCVDGLLLPAWRPLVNVSDGDIFARGLIYFLALVYLFIGVSIIADKFMASIEVITSQEREVRIKKPNGETTVMSVRVWNETVSNLTLMALGSSAPEILLSIIEVYAQDYNAGDLGPGTIVGSAAFNMFVIIAICVWCIPSTEVKKIKHLRVFFVTMVWSVFAYIWLYAILSWFSYGVIEIWEGLLTFAFFPLTVLTAYIADRRLFVYKYLSKQYRLNKRGVIVGGEGADGGKDVEMSLTKRGSRVADGNFKVFDDEANDEVKEFEETRRQYMSILKELRQKNPDAPIAQIEQMARDEIFNRGPKSRAFYRLQATKKLTGQGGRAKKVDKVDQSKKEETAEVDNVITISFDPAHYTVMENVGQFAVTIVREGDLSQSVVVDFKTEDGTANAGGDYEAVQETLVFRAGDTHKQVYITVIDDDVFEEDEHFYCRLSEPRYLHHQENGGSPTSQLKERPRLQLGTPSIATVMILDDDHGGVFSFPEESVEINEAVGCYMLKVTRYSGARGTVFLPYKTVAGSGKSGVDFELTEGQVVFPNNESSAEIPIQIIDVESYEKDVVFYVELSDPIREEDTRERDDNASTTSEDEKLALLGKPRLGELFKCTIRIKESKEFKNTVDALFQKQESSLASGATLWRDQFIEAITVSGGDDDEGGEGEDEEGEADEKMPSCSDYVMHFITLFWKIMFAFVPPPEMANGWLCFVFAIIGIGALTAVIGDLASHLGCTVGLKDTVTAIAFVALGTSVPDTFASKVAAQNDQYADSSVGNVTGSNAVNVFLGIGIAWTIAACVHAYRGTVFEVSPGSLAFSVTLFCTCAFLCCFVLLLRRKVCGGELGGPMRYKLPTTILFVGLWIFYVFMSSLEAYEVIKF
ncbi:Sodium/calcium exchanger 3 [Halotydeus destructor]|nr:Sodium/calcium exchanger 3 [Halotydeus destructor]